MFKIKRGRGGGVHIKKLIFISSCIHKYFKILYAFCIYKYIHIYNYDRMLTPRQDRTFRMKMRPPRTNPVRFYGRLVFINPAIPQSIKPTQFLQSHNPASVGFWDCALVGLWDCGVANSTKLLCRGSSRMLLQQPASVDVHHAPRAACTSKGRITSVYACSGGLRFPKLAERMCTDMKNNEVRTLILWL